MDPLTHGLVGVALSAFSGTAVSIDNPLTIGAMLGAMAPDLDVIIRIFKNDAVYLEHHRGISHTIPFLIGYSVAITGILSLLGLPAFSFFWTFLWSFIGAFSHTALDSLNSYGAKLLKKKFKLSLLTLYDPVITLVGIWLIQNGKNSIYELISGGLIVIVYLLLRNMNRYRSKQQISRYFASDYHIKSITVIPSLKAFYKWDFIVHSISQDIVGQYNPWMIGPLKFKAVRVTKSLDTVDPYYYQLFESYDVGSKFSEFTSNYHIEVIKDLETDQTMLKATDLRYYFKENFMHHATVVIDENEKYISGCIHPYKFERAIPIYEPIH